MQFDAEQVAAELIRALRGSRSQVAFSRRLGYRSNVVAAWEGGRRWPTAADTLAAANRLGIDIEAGLRRFYGVPVPFLADVHPASPSAVTAFLADNQRQRTAADLAEASGFSRHQISRWVRGSAQPRLPEFLRLVDVTTQRLLDWIAILVDPGELPSVAAAWRQLESARTLFWRMPHAQLVLLAITLEAYRALPVHDDRWLSEALGLELYQVTGAVEALLSTEQIRREGTHLVLGRVQTLDTRRLPEMNVALRRYWTEVALERGNHPDGSWSWNACAVSRADRQRIIDLYRSTFREMRAIVSASVPSEVLVLVDQIVVPLGPDALDAPG